MRTSAIVLLIFAVGILAACCGRKPPGEKEPDLARLLPEVSDLEGWTVAEGPVAHAPETLYEYLDGGADRYLGYGFKGLLHIRYSLRDDPVASVTLDVYDMGGKLGAFGIYSAARPPGVEASRWGAEGYRDGTIAAAWKGPVYVHGEADDDRPELVAMLESLVKRVCETIPGEASPPRVLSELPADGRVPGSERWVPANLLGHSFLGGGVLATYEFGGLKSEFYLADLGSSADARRAMEQLRAHLSEWGSIEDELESLGDEAFRYGNPTLGSGTAVRGGGLVVGIHGEIAAEDRERVLAQALARAH